MARIVVVGKYYFPFQGGIEVNTRDVSEHLAARHDVTAVVFNHEPGRVTETVNGVKVIRCGAFATVASQPLSLEMLRVVLSLKPDLIHFHAPNVVGNVAVLLKLFAARRRIPVVITHHMDIFGRPRLRRLAIDLYGRLLRRTDQVVVTSMKNAAISRDLDGAKAISAIPLGIRLEDYAVSEAMRASAKAWRQSLAGSAPVIGFVGRHARYKGLDVLMQALHSLPGVHGFIAGDGPQRASTEELAARLGLTDRVHFLGVLSHEKKLELLASLDIFAFPSTEITEAFGVSQLEAMAVGAPVLASNLPTGVTDVAVDGVTAVVVPPGNAEVLASAMSALLADPERARQLAVNARRSVEEKFSQQVVVAKTAELIERVLADGGASPA